MALQVRDGIAMAASRRFLEAKKAAPTGAAFVLFDPEPGRSVYRFSSAMATGL